MNDILPFLINHWLLSGAFVLVLILLIVNEVRQRAFGVQQISPQQLVDLMNHQKAVVIDVRKPEAFDAGHILGAQNVPTSNFDDKLTSLVAGFKSKPVVVVCEQGVESSKRAAKLKKAGVDMTYCLVGGLVQWRTDQLPLVSTKNS